MAGKNQIICLISGWFNMEKNMAKKYLESTILLVCGIIIYFLFISTLYRYSMFESIWFNIGNYIISSICLILAIKIILINGNKFKRKLRWWDY